MAVRNDITVNWLQSPRIIEVAAPSTEITIQDLLDTLRILSAEPVAMDDDEIVDASGKEILGGGVLVGLTVKLLNARLKFEDRSAPPYIVCDVMGGNLIAVDTEGNNINPIAPSAYVTVTKTASSSATLMIGNGFTPDEIASAVRAELTPELSQIPELYNEAFGKLVLNPTAKTLTLYKTDNSVLKVFDLTSTSAQVPAFIERMPR